MIYKSCLSCKNNTTTMLICSDCRIKASLNTYTNSEIELIFNEKNLLTFCRYLSPFAELINLYKNQKNLRPEFMNSLLAIAAKRLRKHCIKEAIDIVIPIPHKTYPIKFGQSLSYNFAYLLASEISRPIDLNFLQNHSLLSWISTPQKSKGYLDRALSAPQFKVRKSQKKHIALVDDVWTTGATMNSAKQRLEASGHSVSSMICFSHANRIEHIATR